MKKTHRRSLFIVALAYLFLGTSVSAPQQLFAAASGNYTDLLPIGAPSDTTVISRGSGWAITTLPPTQTFGDSLSRLVDTVYQSTAPVTITNTATETLITSSITAKVGSVSFPSSWIATGRSIEVEMDGFYSTGGSGTPNWTWAIKLGTTTILNTGAVASISTQTRSPFKARALMTIGAIGGGSTGNLNGFYDIYVGSGAPTVPMTLVSYSTYTTSAVSCDLGTTSTSQTAVNSYFTWSTVASSITINNVTIKMLN